MRRRLVRWWSGPAAGSLAERCEAGVQQGPFLQVLAGVRGRVDGAAGLVALAADQRADVDDPLALLARDPRPVVGVGRVGQVLVLLELVQARRRQVADPQSPDAGLELFLDRHLLRA